MRHHDERGVRISIQLFEHLDDPFARFLVEIAGRFVREQDLRAIGEGSRQGYSLLLSAGELRREVVESVTEAHTPQERRSLTTEALGGASELQRHQDVLQGGQRREQVKRLKYETDPLKPEFSSTVFAERENVFAVEEDAATGRLVEPGQKAQERRLAAARGADDGHEGLGLDFEIDGDQHRQGPTPAHIGFLEALGHDHHMRRFLFIISMLACATCAQPDNPASAAPDVGGATPAQAPEEETPGGERPAVVFLGTSLTAGLGLVSDDDSYVARLTELADSAGLPFRAVNAGVSGETSAGALRRLDWVLREPLAVLVLELGANDGLRGYDPALLEDNLRTIVDRTHQRRPGTRIVIAGMQAPTNLGRAYTDRFREIFQTVADDTGSALIPFLLEGVAGVPELNQDDRIHPTAEGHERVARNVWAVLESVLRELDGR